MSRDAMTQADVHPVHIDAPEEELDDSAVASPRPLALQGAGHRVQSTTNQELARYWTTDYD
jgi:hypothetical protein